MAEVGATPSFGAELRDGFKPVNAWVSNGVVWLDEIQQFYRERAVIEKEYSSRLYALAKKYFEKKAKKSSNLSVGDTPTLTPGSLERDLSASLTTWTTQLSTVEARAAEHDRYSSDLLLQVAEPLKNIAIRYEELRKSHAEYAGKLDRERDISYGDLKKQKGRYDGACQEVENRRKRTESSFDHSKTKAQNAYQQQIVEMHNLKNTYIISINVTNKQKERYYHEYVPDLLDSLQDLSETRVGQLNSLWSQATNLESLTLSRSQEHLRHLSLEIPRNNPSLDSQMFVQHNLAQWQEPLDMVFEPSPVWLDDNAMATNDTAKIFLRNVLGKSKGQLHELKQDVDKKKKEVESARRIRRDIKEGRDKRDEVELVKAMFALQENLHEAERKRLTAEVEIATITDAVGDVSLGAQNHNFRPQTFKIPTNCDLCGERIWGLSAKGFDCRDCGYTCHSKCEMKVPAQCPGEQSKDEKKKLKAERQASSNVALHFANGASHPDLASELPTLSRTNTLNSLSSGYAASANRSVSGLPLKAPSDEPNSDHSVSQSTGPKSATTRRNRIVAPPPTHYISELPVELNDTSPMSNPREPRAKMIYPYHATGEGELTVEEGQEVTVLEPDDGSGWLTIRTSASASGLVPASYLENLPATLAELERPTSTYSSSSASVAGSTLGMGRKKGPAVAPKRGAKKLKYVEAMYDYEARSDAEWSMTEGEKFVLVSGDAGDGWADVEIGGVRRSVPANYIQEV
ncbi:MAG: hypothetical protein Q9195_005876 [Heterodermia aff. obscurata]